MQAFLHSVGEAITPVLTNSKFKETGVISPKEFELAGNYLSHICPTWRWNSCEEAKVRNYLPLNKQYLSTKNVPCHKRVAQMEDISTDKLVAGVLGDEGGDDDEWVETSTYQIAGNGGKDEEISDIVCSSTTLNKLSNLTIQDVESTEDEDSSDIEDIEDIQDTATSVGIKENNARQNAVEENENILKTRTYDLSITYDKYYQTPRLWLTGYDEHGKPLTEKQMFEDFSQDHAKKTVTFESHPHLPCNMMSIHPCKHADVMKRILQNYKNQKKKNSNNDNPEEYFGVHLYLIIFLKFVQSVIPTIEYDFTTEFSMDRKTSSRK